MTTDPIDPAIVEKAAKAMADDWNPERDPILTAMFRDYAQTAIQAVAADLRAEGVAEERVWSRKDAQRQLDNLRALHEQSSRNAERVDAAYRTVGDRVYKAAQQKRKTVRLADILNGLPMVWQS